MTPAIVAAVLGAGALGAVARWLTARALEPRGPFPWGVLVVNVIGSAIAGAVLGLAEAGGVDAGLRLIVATGLCGGLTTFSTLSVETVQLARGSRWRTALASAAANLVLGLGAAALGYLLAR